MDYGAKLFCPAEGVSRRMPRSQVFFRRCEDPSRTTCEESVALAPVFSWAKTDAIHMTIRSVSDTLEHPSGMVWQMPGMDD